MTHMNLAVFLRDGESHYHHGDKLRKGKAGVKTGGQALSRICLSGNWKQPELEIMGTGPYTSVAQRILAIGAISMVTIMPYINARVTHWSPHFHRAWAWPQNSSIALHAATDLPDLTQSIRLPPRDEQTRAQTNAPMAQSIYRAGSVS